MTSTVTRRPSARSTAARALAGVALLLALSTLAAPANGETLATVRATLKPDRPHARAALTVTVALSGAGSGMPAPVRRATLRFPAGIGIEVPQLRSCSAAHLRAHGMRGCPPRSLLGTGYALAEVLVGSQLITERISLWVFLGEPRNLQPTVAILGQGYTPFDQRTVLTGALETAAPPYGEELVLSIPPIRTVTYEPNASFSVLSFTVGAASHRQPSHSAVLVPSRCPLGGFPLSAELAYAGGSVGNASSAIPCPT